MYITDLLIAFQETPICSAKQNEFIRSVISAMVLISHEQDIPDMTLVIEPANNVNVGGKNFKFAGGNSPTFTAPVGGPETHLLYAYNNAGSLAFAILTSGFTPGDPDTYPIFVQFPIAEVYLTNTTTAITTGMITDVRQLQSGVVSGGTLHKVDDGGGIHTGYDIAPGATIDETDDGGLAGVSTQNNVEPKIWDSIESVWKNAEGIIEVQQDNVTFDFTLKNISASTKEVIW